LGRRSAARKTYQGAQSRFKQKFEVIANRELRVKVMLPIVFFGGKMHETGSASRVLAKEL
jgi:hypothetical protein